jgi:asparagine synthase (glutamine-hydrolysing)
MCGIFAIFGQYDRSDCIQAAETIQHRGPDNSTYCSIKNGLVAFHRLSIMDVSSAGNQPFQGSTWILICNGEIYNAKSLQSKYNVKTYSGSDCEVMFQLLEGGHVDFLDLIQEIYGVYSIVAYNQKTEKIFVARDPVGIRPLFMLQQKQRIMFASEPCVLQHLTTEPENIVPFLPGTVMCFDINANPMTCITMKNRTLIIPFQPTIHNIDDAVKNTREIVEKVVRCRLITDRPVACFLSGGVDSSAIAALVAKYSTERIHTFSIGLAGSTDLVFARQVAQHINSIHCEIVKTEQEFLNAIPEVIRAIQSYDVTTVRASTPMYLLSKYISQNTDFKVIFSGEGPDEVCGSYMYFHASPDPLTSAEECRRLVRDMHYFDVLRSDRSTASWGLEVRVPFLAVDFIRNYWSIDPCLRVPQQGIEKYILRRAVEDLLPYSVTWRPKEAFSDGVSAKERSWSSIIGEFVRTMSSYQNCDFTQVKYLYPHHTPQTPEALWMRDIYNGTYPHMEHLIPYQWLPKWVGNVQDPSARILQVYK